MDRNRRKLVLIANLRTGKVTEKVMHTNDLYLLPANGMQLIATLGVVKVK